MQQVTTSTDRTRGLIDSIASHLRHPGFGGVSGDAGEGNTPCLQVEKEEDVIGNETTPSQDLNGEEVCSGKDGHVGGDEVLPSRALAAFRRRRDGVPLQNVSDRLIGDLMAEIGESASDAIVTPGFVLPGHAEHSTSLVDPRRYREGGWESRSSGATLSRQFLAYTFLSGVRIAD